MGKLDGYKIDLKGMADDNVSYRWHADNDFFSAVQGPEIRQGQLDVALWVKKTPEVYDLEFHLQGMVQVTCDRCLEPMDQPIDALCTLRVKMGSEYDDDGDVVTIPDGEGTINVAWNIYEFAALQIPLRHVHPKGKCKVLLPELSANEEGLDPRWDALKALVKNDK
ncbi:MAG: DUF177 domain-containing protein [Prevotellaceae bacterium]|nr:DUF177 domain-containing protein [Prevotellaceae bacterium]